MRLHSVEVQNWRQHNSLKIEFHEAATIIFGPNETGKSTILEALSKGFFDRSSSQSESIKRIKPLTAHGNVASFVRIEFTLDDVRYRVEKSFNWKRGTQLYRLSEGKTILLAQDDSADEHLIRLLEAQLPSSRGSKPSQWGAFQWLWAAQDNRDLPTESEGNLTASLHLETPQSGAVLVTNTLLLVQKSLAPLYRRNYTETGRISANSPMTELQSEIDRLEAREHELIEKIAMVDDKKRQLDNLQQQLPGIEARLEESRKQLAKERAEAADFSSIEAELKASEAQVSEAQRDKGDAERALKDLKAASKKIEQLESTEMQVRQDHSRQEAVCQMLEKQLGGMREDVESKAVKVRDFEELVRDARILWSKSDTDEKFKTMKKTVERAKSIDVKIKRIDEQMMPLVPTAKELEALKKQQTRIEILKQSLQTGGLTVSLTRGKRGTLSVEVDGHTLGKGTPHAVGTDKVTVSTPGFGKATITANLAQMRDVKAEMTRLETAVKSELGKFTANSLGDLIELFQAQDKLSRKAKELRAERKGIDERSLVELELDLKKLRDKSETYGNIERTALATRSNPTNVDLSKLIKKREKEEREARMALDKARQGRDDLEGRLSSEKQTLAELRAQQTHTIDELKSARLREREILGQYGTIALQEGKLTSATQALEEKKEERDRIKDRYNDLLKGPVNRIRRLEREVENGEGLVKQQRSAIDQLVGAINMASLEGPYSDLAQIASRIEVSRSRLQSERTKAEACKLVNDTLEQQYRSALLAVVGPIKQKVERFLGYVTQDMHRNVQLSEDLLPTSISERGLEGLALSFGDGSSGLREVLSLCVRLAIAEHLSKHEPQCVAFDDPFVHVSSERSNRMVELINDAIEEYSLQAIIFTHRPSEFAGFNGKLVDIRQLALQ